MEGLALLSLIALVALVLYSAWSIGANDETVAPVVSGRSLDINTAILMGSVVGVLGAVFLGENVQKCIGSQLLNQPMATEGALIILFCSSTWLTLVSWRGYSVSTTHSTVSAIVGYGLASLSISVINWPMVAAVIEGWLFSLILGFVGAFVLTKIMLHVKSSSSKDHGKFERNFSKLLIFSTFLLQFSRWGNDVGNAAGMLVGVVDPRIGRFICALAMAFGLFVLGRLVVGTVGIKMVRLMPSTAFVAQITATAIIFPFAYTGIPLSGTHVLISSMLGTGVASKAKVNTRITEVFSVAWILSFIAPGILAAIIVFASQQFL